MVDWDAMELEAFNLRYEDISQEDMVARAKSLAALFREHRQPPPETVLSILRQHRSQQSQTRREQLQQSGGLKRGDVPTLKASGR